MSPDLVTTFVDDKYAKRFGIFIPEQAFYLVFLYQIYSCGMLCSVGGF